MRQKPQKLRRICKNLLQKDVWRDTRFFRKELYLQHQLCVCRTERP